MAAGKSTVGRRLAARLGWEFVDFDDAVLARTGQTAGALIRERGVGALRRVEAEVTRELAGHRRVVLAPGGGWAANPELAAALGPDTVRVWLRVSATEALRRAAAAPADRPLLGPTPRDVERLLREREPHYAAAELAVDVDGREPDAVVDEILRRLPSTGGR